MRAASLCVVLGLALVASSCTQYWRRVEGGPVRSADGALELQPPAGWVRWLGDDSALAFTRDGPHVQLLVVQVTDAADAFPSTGRAAEGELLTAELAERAIGELRTRAGLAALELLENDPVVIDGRAGFRLRYRQTQASGLRTDHLLFCCLADDRYVRISYAAPTLHYFDRDRAAVEEAALSFRLEG